MRDALPQLNEKGVVNREFLEANLRFERAKKKEIETKIDAPIRKKEAQNRGALFRTNLKNLQKQEKILANLERLQAKGATESRADKIKQRQQIIRDLELKLGRQSGAGPIVNAPVSAPTTKTTNISQISKSFTTKDPVLEQVAMESFP